MRYREAGEGKPIVLVHGLGVSADYWIRVGPPLAAEGFRVLAPDLPGFGRSAGLSGGLGVRAQADAVRAWALALDLPPAVYVGHSLSAQSVLELAAEHPDSIVGILLAGPTGDGPAGRRLIRQAIALLRDIPRESLLLATMVGSAYLHAGPLKVIRTWILGAKHDPLPLLARVAAPSLVVIGERDPVVRRRFADRLAAGLSDGHVVVIPDAAHAVIFDQTGAFNQTLASFASRVHGRARTDPPPITRSRPDDEATGHGSIPD